MTVGTVKSVILNTIKTIEVKEKSLGRIFSIPSELITDTGKNILLRVPKINLFLKLY